MPFLQLMRLVDELFKGGKARCWQKETFQKEDDLIPESTHGCACLILVPEMAQWSEAVEVGKIKRSDSLPK